MLLFFHRHWGSWGQASRTFYDRTWWMRIRMWLGNSMDLVPRFWSDRGFSTTCSPMIVIPLSSSFSFSHSQVKMFSSNLLEIIVIMQVFHSLLFDLDDDFIVFFNKFHLIIEWVLLIITIITLEQVLLLLTNYLFPDGIDFFF